jgi:hypothetical protein
MLAAAVGLYSASTSSSSIIGASRLSSENLQVLSVTVSVVYFLD